MKSIQLLKETKMYLLFIVILVLASNSSFAQSVSDYIFTDTVVTYQSISGGTVLGDGNEGYGSLFLFNDTDGDSISDNGGNGSATSGPGYPIGFTFQYNGVVYDRFAVHNNGFITLGKSSATPSVLFDDQEDGNGDITRPISEEVTFVDNVTAMPLQSDFRNRISAMGTTLYAKGYLAIPGVLFNTSLRFDTIGVSPNRELVVQWENYLFPSSTATDVSFQIRLHENTNAIDFIYNINFMSDTDTTYYGLNETAEIGLAGFLVTDATQFINRTISGNAPDWSTTSPGLTNNATCLLIDSTTLLPSGLRFRFSPIGVGMNEDVFANAINFYPNPTSDKLTIEITDISSGEPIVLTIVDVQGREVFSRSSHASGSIHRENIDVSNLGSGMYFVKITSENKSVVKKLIIN
jgi:hypothetical protein